MEWLKRYRIWIIGAVVVLTPVVALAWWLGSPLFINKTVEEQFPLAHSAVLPANMTRSEVESLMAGMAKVDQAMEEPMSATMLDATVVKAGEFTDADSRHKGQGTGKIYRLGDGSHVFRLESFRVTNGPDLRVILSPHPDPRSREAVKEEGYIELGKLKGNIGNQNYSIPEGIDASTFNSAVIYCKPFHVIFSVAILREEG